MRKWLVFLSAVGCALVTFTDADYADANGDYSGPSGDPVSSDTQAGANELYVCSGICPNGVRITRPANFPMIYMTESECSTAAASILANQCTTISSAVVIEAYGPFKTQEAATSFRDNVLVAMENYFKEASSANSSAVTTTTSTTPAPATQAGNIPLECRSSTRRETVETSVSIDTAIGEASCDCNSFVRELVLVSLSFVPICFCCADKITQLISLALQQALEVSIGVDKTDTFCKAISKAALTRLQSGVGTRCKVTEFQDTAFRSARLLASRSF